MSEILDFPGRDQRRTLTAYGRFLLAANEQAEAAEKERKMCEGAKKPKPAQIRTAKKELDHLFSGKNAEVSEQLYKEGLDDLVSKRKPTEERQIYILLPGHSEAMQVTINAPLAYTEATLFYIHVETLTGIANQAYDHAPTAINTARLARLDSSLNNPL